MEQVRKEMQTNESLRKSMKEFKEAGGVEKSSNLKENINKKSQQIKDTAGSAFSKTSEAFSHFHQKLSETSQKLSQISESHPLFKSMKVFSLQALDLFRSSAGKLVDGTTSVLSYFKDEKAEEARRKAEKWRSEMEKKRDPARDVNDTEHTESTADEQTYALIISEDSAWDRFGTKLRDMPFLHNFFENPMIGKLLGESAQAAALREMKTIDPSFRLPELVDLMEHVIAPHLLSSFLHGERETLQMQCGQAAFGAIDHSIKERETLKLDLDPSVLLLRNVEFRGASCMPDKTPWFIFTFNAQQINCMRDKADKVVVGAVDDIREVVYSVALTKHPEPETPGLEYPWQVAEFAIIGNQPCW